MTLPLQQRRRLRAFASLALAGALALGGCATAPDPAPAVAPVRAPEDVELTLNLPDQASGCECTLPGARDATFLERGVVVLARGDYIEAVQYFQRYQRLEKTPLAQWEARLAIAYASMLPSSPFYDVDAARAAYVELQADEPEGEKHHSVVLMQQALETFVSWSAISRMLENRAAMLQEDLDKREQALKRLRELTLGQPEGAP
jgi:tetratricopeptide (TPR) repeat protein